MAVEIAVLLAQDLSVTYGGLQALCAVNVRVEAGQLVGLIGPNGAGKTTALDALSGFASALGTVILEGRNLTGASPAARCRAGLIRTWQSAELFEGLTVADNLRVAADPGGLAGALRELFARPTHVMADVTHALEALRIGSLAERMPHQLSHGERKLVGVARALASKPRILLLDEPSAGLDSTESAQLGTHLRALADTGLSQILVEHDMDIVLGICDYIYVLDRGRLISEGTPSYVRGDPAVIASYLGTDEDQHEKHAPRKPKQEVGS